MRHPSQRRRSDRATSAIATFFVEQAAGKPQSVVRRYEIVEQQLLAFLHTADLEGALTPQQVSLVMQARRSGGGFFAVCDLGDMVGCLPLFVSGGWLLPTPVDARTQVSLVGRLISWLQASGELGSAHDVAKTYEVLASVAAARRALEHQSRGERDEVQGHDGQGAPPRLRLIRGGKAD